MTAELQVTSNYSFLRGASHVEELFAQAALFGYKALAITDHNSLAGIARAHQRAEETGVRLIVGCRLDLTTGESLLVYPEDRAAYARLCRLLSIGKGRAGKGACHLAWPDLVEHAKGLLAVLLPDSAESAAAQLAALHRMFPGRSWLALTLRRRPGDMARLHALADLARSLRIPTVATGDVLFHDPARRRLQDVMTCIREGCTIDAAGFKRERSADRHLLPSEEIARRFHHFPEAVAARATIAERCRFSLVELKYQYPHEAMIPGLTAQQALERYTWAGAAARYPGGVPAAVAAQLRHELELIAELDYAPYFLTVHSIVQYSNSQGILCQGRGSAANSAVCYVLGITAIDPMQSNLLFERFISAERREPPDIDVDFEHERREEIIQWIYRTYGRHRAALCATVARYRSRGAIREVGKVLGLTEDVTSALAGQVWGWSDEGVGDNEIARLNLNAADPRLALAIELARELIGFPRHLSQHPGGFVLTQDRLDELVPIEPAAMQDRQVIEWDKDDIDTLRFMKVDVLGLGMLGCMRRAFDLLERHGGEKLTLASIPQEDEKTYAMIRRADTLGVFQIESRAQMSMLPRMKPRTFYDLVIEVAIVRPGPIQGDMVHPYLRRREGVEKEAYPTPELEKVLGKTLGVPLFQEQAMKVAIVCAGFTPGEADALRRSMATFKVTGGVSHFRDKLIEGMVRNSYTREFAERTFRQIEGFGSYGFPESHAASFALLAYASSWMKCHHPDVFACALLNAQPMGFYAPAQIVRDARDHGVVVRPVSVNDSAWDCTLEPPPSFVRWAQPTSPPPNRHCERSEAIQEPGTSVSRTGYRPHPLRFGLRMAKGLSESDAAVLLANRHALYASVQDLHARTKLPPQALERLAEADAFACLGLSRRGALWQVRALPETELPLFAEREQVIEPETHLVAMPEGREVVEDYRAVGLTLRRHPVAFLRADLAARRIVPTAGLLKARNGARLTVAGIVLVRQKPGSAKGVLFMTIEDETSHANLVVWPSLFDQRRLVILSASMVACRGRVQRVSDVIHIVAEEIEDLSPLLRSVGQREDFPHITGRGDEARHGGAPDPRGIAVRTRDFR